MLGCMLRMVFCILHVRAIVLAMTDEINQCLHSVCNSLHDFESPIAYVNIISSNETAVLTASGPSLDQQLPLLKQFDQEAVTLLFQMKCGSSLGSLLAAGITPSALVLLEMDSKVLRTLTYCFSKVMTSQVLFFLPQIRLTLEYHHYLRKRFISIDLDQQPLHYIHLKRMQFCLKLARRSLRRRPRGVVSVGFS